jgi:hypothetical protein
MIQKQKRIRNDYKISMIIITNNDDDYKIKEITTKTLLEIVSLYKNNKS